MDKKAALKCIVAAAICATTLVAYRSFGWTRMGPANSLGLDLSRPDALVLTRSIASLPRDLLTIPLARDVLREDFVFYYEQGEDRLGLKGSLRRIAYEHELTWGDQLIRMVLDEPAEVALWRDGDGTLKHYAIALTRGKLARLLEEAGKVALKDSQMRLAGKLRVGQDEVPVFALDYAYRRTLLFAARGERMVILSDPGMLYGAPGAGEDEEGHADPAAHAVVSRLLAPDAAGQGVFRGQFRLPSGIPSGHSVVVKADFLSFGYQPFFGALQALRFDFAKGHWQTQVLIDGSALPRGGYDSTALWDALPAGARACYRVPPACKAWARGVRRLGAPGAAAPALEALSAQFSGPAAACWYPSSRLYTPVFVARRKPSANATPETLLGALFAAAVGGEPGERAGQAGARWQRTVQTPEGALTPTLAASGDTVAFSADPALVDAVLAVQRKQAAATSDRLPDPAHTLGIIHPAALSQLVRREAFDALPPASEPVLRAAADAHLAPRLDALASYPAYRMVAKKIPGSGAAWTPLEWQAVR